MVEKKKNPIFLFSTNLPLILEQENEMRRREDNKKGSDRRRRGRWKTYTLLGSLPTLLINSYVAADVDAVMPALPREHLVSKRRRDRDVEHGRGVSNGGKPSSVMDREWTVEVGGLLVALVEGGDGGADGSEIIGWEWKLKGDGVVEDGDLAVLVLDFEPVGGGEVTGGDREGGDEETGTDGTVSEVENQGR